MMNGISMWSWRWWRDVGERALRTCVAVLIPALGASEAGFSIVDANWIDALELSAGAGITTILMAIATHGITGNGPSFTSVYKDKPTGESGKDDRTDAAA